VDRCIAHARAQGAAVVEEPHDITDEHGTVPDPPRLPHTARPGTVSSDGPLHRPYLPGYVSRRSGYVKPAGAPKRSSRRWDTWWATSSWVVMDEWGRLLTTESWASPTWRSLSARNRHRVLRAD